LHLATIDEINGRVKDQLIALLDAAIDFDLLAEVVCHGDLAQAYHRQPSRLSDRPEPARPQLHCLRADRIWVADITYVETDQGWLYLAIVMDLYSRRIVGWAMEDNLRAELPLAALRMAISAKRPGAGLIHHSDRGVQYASADYRKMMQSAGFKVSMSRKADCYDNAPMESFFHTLKTELVHHRQYATRKEATRDIFAYIEGFYNRIRRHSAIGYISPIEMELKAA
jgi:transposase InsO family protein